MGKEKLIITPKTKVGELLDAYPQLEDILIGIVPVFKKLKNPVLRKTVARVTSLQQAAIVGKVPLEKIIKPLREAVGQTGDIITEEEKKYFQEKPEWFKKELIVETINAGKLLDSGDNPMGNIIDAANTLENKSILKVVHTFVPAPIIDMLDKKNFNYWLEKNSDETISIYFSKK